MGNPGSVGETKSSHENSDGGIERLRNSFSGIFEGFCISCLLGLDTQAGIERFRYRHAVLRDPADLRNDLTSLDSASHSHRGLGAKLRWQIGAEWTVQETAP